MHICRKTALKGVDMENDYKNSILIVDDSQLVIMELTRILGKEYILRAASNGEDGLQAAETYLPDVILLDIIMPGLDGYEVLAKLKESEKTRHIPVILITSLSDKEIGRASCRERV